MSWDDGYEMSQDDRDAWDDLRRSREECVMGVYHHPVLNRLSERLMAYSLASWDDAWLIQSERELHMMRPDSELQRIDRAFWLDRVRQEMAKRDGDSP